MYSIHEMEAHITTSVCEQKKIELNKYNTDANNVHPISLMINLASK